MINHLITTALLLITTTDFATARDLRPSLHGLPFQSLPTPTPQSSEMSLFFGETAVSSPPPRTPAAVEVTDTWWSETPEKRKEMRVRKALVIATVACGGTGVALLLVAALLFGVRFYRRHRLLVYPPSSLVTDPNNNGGNNSVTAIVPAPALSIK